MEGKISQNGTDLGWKIGKEDYEFLGKVIPGFVKDFIGILNDKFYERRAEKQLELLQKRKEKVKKSGKELQSIEPKLFFSIIGNGSLEDNETIQEKRVNLLYNATTNGNIIIGYSEILKELGSNEVKVLDKIFNDGVILSQKENTDLEKIVFETEKISKLFNIPINDVKLMIDNFYRLRLVEPPEFIGMSTGGEEKLHPILKTNMFFQLSYLGLSFIKACKSE